MAVIINDFEIVVEPPAEAAAAAEAAPAPAPSTPLTPQDLRDVFQQQVERQVERQARLRAH